MRDRLPLLATSFVCLALYLISGWQFEGFFTTRVAFNLLSDNAFLGVIAVGMTFVILTGGIDLSVGSLVACTGVVLATLIQKFHWHPFAAILAVLALGFLVGVGHGVLVAKFDIAPFLATLAGLFFCRGVGLWVSKESIQIDHPAFSNLADFAVKLPGGAKIPLITMVFVVVLLAGVHAAKQTRFGRAVYAIGGNRQSAELMGLPVSRTLVGVYALSGVCAALGGVVFSLYTLSGNALTGTGMELDAIAAVVIGGTLLSGGYGSVFGSFIGVVILGIIQTAITFQGTLSSWWTKIFIGVLLLIFMLLQKGIERSIARKVA